MRVSRRELDPSPWLAALVFAASVAAFSPALLNGFVVWDDDIYLTKNPVFHGPALAAAKWALTSTLYGHYMPLVWLSFAADYALHGLNPGWFHLTNVLLHAAACVLLFFILRELVTKAGGLEAGSPDAAAYAAAAGALFFAVHPLRTESVAWAVERKDMVVAVVWAAAVLAYVGGRRMVALALFALSLLCKVSGIALPGALLVLDVYPLRRLPGDPRRWTEDRWRPVLLEKAAFAAVAVAAAVMSFWALGRSGDLHGLAVVGAKWRLDAALYGLWFYPLKTLWPSGLSPLYEPRPWFGTWAPLAALAAASLCAGAAAWALRRRAPCVPAALAAYALLALPALGLVQNGQPSAACDRYSYLPSFALAALVCAAAFLAARRWRAWARALAALLICALGAAAYRQTLFWRDTETLWTRALAVEPDCGVAFMNLGLARAEAGKYQEGVDLFVRAARAGVDQPELDEDLGGALARLGRSAEAEAAFRRALAKKPALAQSRRELGMLLAEGPASGWQEAQVQLRAAGAHGDLAALLAREGRTAEALDEYRRAIAADPADGAALNNLGLLLDARGKRAEARALYRRALRVTGVRALANYNWGNSLLASREDRAAELHFREALRLQPGMARACVNLANILARRGRWAEAVRLYDRALADDPGLAEARANREAVRRLLRR